MHFLLTNKFFITQANDINADLSLSSSLFIHADDSNSQNAFSDYNECQALNKNGPTVVYMTYLLDSKSSEAVCWIISEDLFEKSWLCVLNMHTLI